MENAFESRRDIDVAAATVEDASAAQDRENREILAAQGILFCEMRVAAREYPDLIEEYFATVIPPGDDEFAAFDTSLWSRGSFVYVPPGVEAEVAIQSLTRIDSEAVGQFERTLIIADEGSTVHYVEGCSAPVYTNNALRSPVVEIVVKNNAHVAYTTLQNWSPNVDNLVAKGARVEAGGHVELIDGDIGSKRTAKCSVVHLVGEGASGEARVAAHAGAGQHQDTGAKIVHAAPNTTSKIVCKSVSKDGGTTISRGLVRIEEGATGATSHVVCDALVMDERSTSRVLPNTEVAEDDAQVRHHATVSNIADAQLFYLQSRGLSVEQAMGMIANGFVESVTKTLPTEYAVEWSRLIELQMQGSVG